MPASGAGSFGRFSMWPTDAVKAATHSQALPGAGKAIVAGAAGGLGRVICERLCATGFEVVALDHDATGLEKMADYLPGLYPFVCDLRNEQDVLRAIGQAGETLSNCDILVNSAMWISYERLHLIATEHVHRMVDIGILSVVWAMRAALPLLRRSASASVINFTSPVAERGFAGATIYGATKGAVAALTRQAAVEWAHEGIRVNAISPGPMETPGASAVVDVDGFEARRRKTPLGRLGSPVDIANAALFLASPAASFITGEVLHVDGGLSIAGI